MSRALKLILFSFTVAAGFVYFNFRSHYDPFWHKEVGLKDNKSTISPSTQQSLPESKSSRTFRAQAQTPSATQQLPLEVPFKLTPGLHYYADYNISDLKIPPKPVTTKFQYFPCEPPKCILVSHYPRIAYLPHFLTDEECDAIIHEASSRMVRSQVALFKDHAVGEKDVQEVRTSMQTWLDPSRAGVSKIRSRLEDLTGVKEGELLQVLHYGIGQKYDAHNDFFDPKLYGAQASNRAITNFLYLNTVEEGGETWFPRANRGPHPPNYISCDRGLRVRPVKGTLVAFYDMTSDGMFDVHSLHGACPVKKGEKWGGTQWLRVPTDASSVTGPD